MVNLSSHTLSKYELSISSKGLTFIPKPKYVDSKDIELGLEKLLKQLKIQYKTKSKITETPPSQPIPTYNPFQTIKKFKLPDKTTTTTSMGNEELDQLVKKIAKDLEPFTRAPQKTQKDNITRSERRALSNLKNNETIVINKADKGSTVVVQDKDTYIAEGLVHLNNPNMYRKLTHDLTTQTKTKISEFLDKLEKSKLMVRDMIDFCKPPREHRTSQLYFLKKIHKNPMGIRPIMSSINSITENTSK